MKFQVFWVNRNVGWSILSWADTFRCADMIIVKIIGNYKHCN